MGDKTFFEAKSPCGSFHQCNNAEGCFGCEFEGEE
jgi:predicted Fe-S protein YdhL (DUF1289 family)